MGEFSPLTNVRYDKPRCLNYASEREGFKLNPFLRDFFVNPWHLKKKKKTFFGEWRNNKEESGSLLEEEKGCLSSEPPVQMYMTR